MGLILPSLDREKNKMESFSGVKVFSATKFRERGALGEEITFWIQSNPDKFVVDKEVRQSSDSEFHCLSIILFYQEGTVVTKGN